jgi:8-oxo-dGTP pyrophosphatase MutT (NUDIX family)
MRSIQEESPGEVTGRLICVNRRDVVDVLQLGKRVLVTQLSGRKTHGGVGILLNHRGQVLLVLARYRTTWTFPGGWAEPNEDPATAIRRELTEEVAYPTSAPPLRIVHSSERARHTEYVALALVDANVADRLHPVSWEIRDARWCGPDEMPRTHPLTRSLMSNGEGVLGRDGNRWVLGPRAVQALAT